MKKSIIALTFICLLNNIQAQVQSVRFSQHKYSVTNHNQFKVQRGKNLTNTGWILLGSGIVLYGATLITGVIELENLSSGTATITLFTIGTSSMIASIPFFIAGSITRRNASVIFQQNQIPLGLENNRITAIRSVGIGIPLGK